MKTRGPIHAFFLCLSLVFGFGTSACASKAAVDLDQQQIDQMMVTRKEQFESCFWRARESNPQLVGGHVVIRVEHAPDGKLVAPRSLKTFPGSGPVVDCLKNEIAQITLDRPRTRGPVDLEWSFEVASSPSPQQSN